MRTFSLFLILLFFLSSCQTDDFEGTKRYFLTDKEVYQIGDEFELTAVIESDKEKEIRFYDNFKNLQISFALMNEERNIQNGSWSKSSDEFLPESKIKTFQISKENPLKKVLRGQIDRADSLVLIKIPELNFKAKFDVSEFDENTKVRIHGHSMPINPPFGASLEEFFEVKDIRIEI